ncbi:MAG: EVE domain-containing protein [Chitinophagaceae bacterium]|nr:EVE domain-containing protein [Chitinophagaceae bacterium]
MKYWLIKTEPETFSWDTFVNMKGDMWDGVRNYQARNNLKAMKVGDLAFFYHSGNEKSIVGIAKVVKEFYPDPTNLNPKEDWVVVDFIPQRKLLRPISLEEIKKNTHLSQMPLTKVPRLSVQPVTQEEFQIIENLEKQS